MIGIAALISVAQVHAEQCELPDPLPRTLELDQSCIYEKSLIIEQGNSIIDCHGAIFDGKARFPYGLLIDSKGERLDNVIIQNCTFRNFKRDGVRVTWSGYDSFKTNNKRERYARSPSQIVLKKLNVIGNSGSGIFIDDYVTNVIITDSVIAGNAGVGVYLEHSSKSNKILGNQFVRNGYRKFKNNREAVAIDSSAENEVSRNYFLGNAAGGIFLYKNCGENIDNGRQVIRWQHSNHNLIKDNVFLNEKVAVWIAARQSRNLRKWGCGDASIDKAGRYYEDFANYNRVIENTFANNFVAVRVEGDHNKIEKNNFFCGGGVSLDFPQTKREIFLGLPTVGNVVKDNALSSCQAVDFLDPEE